MLQDLSPAIFSLSVFNEHPIKVFNNCTDFDSSRFWRKLLSQVVKKKKNVEIKKAHFSIVMSNIL